MDKLTRCAQILWSVTRHLTPSAGQESNLAEARVELAKLIYKLDGAGFPPPVVPDSAQRNSPEWVAAVEATKGLNDQSIPLGDHVVLWPAIDKTWTPSSRPTQSPALPIAWPYSNDSIIVARYGPFIDLSAEKKEVMLFVFESIDIGMALRDGADVSPGLYPRNWLVQSSTINSTTSRSAKIWATVLASLALVLAIYTVTSIYVAGKFARGAAKEMFQDVKLDNGKIYKCVTNDGKLQWEQDNDNGKLCDEAWKQAWLKQKPILEKDSALLNQIKEANDTKDWWDNIKKLLWKYTSVHQNISLLWSFIDGAAAILLLILAAGLIGRGYLWGALIDGRNRISLERLQQLSWTIVILGGYAVLALFNVALLSSYVREKIQQATTSPEVSTDIPNLFPSMDPTLWAVLGITAVLSPYLSKRILTSKGQPNTEDFQQVQVKPIVSYDPLDTRSDPQWSRWSDLFMSESKVTQGTIDVSRLQHLVITILLLFTYVLLLLDYASAVSGKAIMLAVTSGVPVFTTMPPVDMTFVGLLTLSHAGYLVFKSMPKDNIAPNTNT